MVTKTEELFRKLPSQSLIAFSLGLSDNAISKWRRQGYIPANQILNVWELANGRLKAGQNNPSLKSLLEETRDAQFEIKELENKAKYSK